MSFFLCLTFAIVISNAASVQMIWGSGNSWALYRSSARNRTFRRRNVEAARTVKQILTALL